MEPKYSKSEVKSWLEHCLKRENLSEIVIQQISCTEAGEGATGDVIFADVQARGANGCVTTYHLALKCSKVRKIRGEASVATPMFLNEIHFYENILSAYRKFEMERGIEDPFNSIPKYFGSYITGDRDVIALENVSKTGYSLWKRTKPMTLNHIKLILKEYARLHATSAAMGSENPTAYSSMLEPLNRLFETFEKGHSPVLDTFFRAVGEMYDLLKGELDEKILLKWKYFAENTQATIFEKMKEVRGFKIVTHGDCWNNNYMFQTDENNKELPTKVTILDWQITKVSSPVTDLAHFLFASISEKDLENLDDILNEYHENFLGILLKLQVDPKVYTKEQFWKEWKEYSRYGIMMVPITLKICLREDDIVIDLGEAEEQGNFAETFSFEIRNKELLKSRIKPVVKYIVENNLV